MLASLASSVATVLRNVTSEAPIKVMAEPYEQGQVLESKNAERKF